RASRHRQRAGHDREPVRQDRVLPAGECPMSEIIPLQAFPSQQVQVQLNGQAVTLNIFQQAYGLYVDVFVGASAIIQGVIAENLNRIVRSTYLGFEGDFAFWDTQGEDDPIYTGLGSRFQLVYIDPTDLATLE